MACSGLDQRLRNGWDLPSHCSRLCSVSWAPILAPARPQALAYSRQVPGLKELTS